jgi:hypothetical protein
MVTVSFIGGGNRSAQRKQPTCRKLLTNFITYWTWSSIMFPKLNRQHMKGIPKKSYISVCDCIRVIIINWQVLIVRKLENKVVLNEHFNIAKWSRTIIDHKITVCNSELSPVWKPWQHEIKVLSCYHCTHF